MQAYRCEVCGHVHFGLEPASMCPFCGSSQKYICLAAEYVEEGELKGLSDATKKDIRKAIAMEYNDMMHYRYGYKHCNIDTFKMIFYELATHEEHHAEALEKMLGLEEGSLMPEEPTSIEGLDPNSPSFIFDVFRLSLDNEMNAMRFYQQVSKENEHPRVKLVFNSLAQVEYRHAMYNKMFS